MAEIIKGPATVTWQGQTFHAVETTISENGWPIVTHTKGMTLCDKIKGMDISLLLDPSDNPAADAATQFDVMTARGYKLNMLKGVYEK